MSARLVFAGLRYDAGRTTQQLSGSLGIPERTVRSAVRWLIDHGLASRRPDLRDTRRYRIVLTHGRELN